MRYFFGRYFYALLMINELKWNRNSINDLKIDSLALIELTNSNLFTVKRSRAHDVILNGEEFIVIVTCYLCITFRLKPIKTLSIFLTFFFLYNADITLRL